MVNLYSNLEENFSFPTTKTCFVFEKIRAIQRIWFLSFGILYFKGANNKTSFKHRKNPDTFAIEINQVYRSHRNTIRVFNHISSSLLVITDASPKADGTRTSNPACADSQASPTTVSGKHAPGLLAPTPVKPIQISTGRAGLNLNTNHFGVLPLSYHILSPTSTAHASLQQLPVPPSFSIRPPALVTGQCFQVITKFMSQFSIGITYQSRLE